MKAISNHAVPLVLIGLGAIIARIPPNCNPACHEVGAGLITAELAIYTSPSTENGADYLWILRTIPHPLKKPFTHTVTERRTCFSQPTAILTIACESPDIRSDGDWGTA
jgi:hypothetical protein